MLTRTGLTPMMVLPDTDKPTTKVKERVYKQAGKSDYLFGFIDGSTVP
jgi:hypothetical protein